MAKNASSRAHLDRVVDMVDQVIDATVEFLVQSMKTMDQVVLNATREKTLRDLQALLEREQEAARPNLERFWRITSCILGTVIAILLEASSGSVSYEFSRERWPPIRSEVSHRSRLSQQSYIERS
jgi:hypothetical protein